VEYAKRHAFFVYPRDDAPAYAVVFDDIQKDDERHEFTWQMMYSDLLVASLADGRATFAPIEASGSGYVDTPFNLLESGETVSRSGSCEFTFDIDEPSEYVLWARVRTEAEERGQADSFFVRMDDGRRVDWHMPAGGAWVWGKVSAGVERKQVSYKLQAGKHRLSLGMREPGAQVDCVLLTRNREAVPSFPAAWKEPLFMEAELGRLVGAMRLVEWEGTNPRLVVHVDAASKLSLSTDVFEPADYHGPAAFPRFRATVRDVNPRFFAVLLPLPASVKEPEVRFRPDEGKRRVEIEWPGHVDVLEWSESDGSLQFVERP